MGTNGKPETYEIPTLNLAVALPEPGDRRTRIVGALLALGQALGDEGELFCVAITPDPNGGELGVLAGSIELLDLP